MSGSVIHSQSAVMVPAVYSAGQPASLPVAIDYPAALALRQMSMVHDELPKYLLAPEVSALLHYVPDLHRKMLLATLWNTGARINEALALTRGDFSLAPPYPFVQLATLKQRTEKAARTAGRMPAGQQTHRLVPLSDSWCQRQDYWPFFAIFNVRYWSLMLSAFRHFIITDWRGVFCQHSR
ncbi:hypothetical protein ACFL9N_25875, partial [Escherichia coli]